MEDKANNRRDDVVDYHDALDELIRTTNLRASTNGAEDAVCYAELLSALRKFETARVRLMRRQGMAP